MLYGALGTAFLMWPRDVQMLSDARPLQMKVLCSAAMLVLGEAATPPVARPMIKVTSPTQSFASNELSNCRGVIYARMLLLRNISCPVMSAAAASPRRRRVVLKFHHRECCCNTKQHYHTTRVMEVYQALYHQEIISVVRANHRRHQQQLHHHSVWVHHHRMSRQMSLNLFLLSHLLLLFLLLFHHQDLPRQLQCHLQRAAATITKSGSIVIFLRQLWDCLAMM